MNPSVVIFPRSFICHHYTVSPFRWRSTRIWKALRQPTTTHGSTVNDVIIQTDNYYTERLHGQFSHFISTAIWTRRPRRKIVTSRGKTEFFLEIFCFLPKKITLLASAGFCWFYVKMFFLLRAFENIGQAESFKLGYRKKSDATSPYASRNGDGVFE